MTGEVFYIEASEDEGIIDSVQTFMDALDFAADLIVRRHHAEAITIFAGDLDGPHESAARVESLGVSESFEAEDADAELVLTIDAPAYVPAEVREIARRTPPVSELEYGPLRSGKRDRSRVYVQFNPLSDDTERRFAELEINRARKNPCATCAADGDPEDLEAAVEKYESFHRYGPKKILELDFAIPRRVRCIGDAKHVLYRSGKVDPDTLKKPRKPVDYIHEHDAGVECYVTDGKADTDVPEEFSKVTSLTFLGKCLGFALKDGTEAEGTHPLPDLCCTPDGHCLLVVQRETKRVLAMMWGGGLQVLPEGIDG